MLRPWFGRQKAAAWIYLVQMPRRVRAPVVPVSNGEPT